MVVFKTTFRNVIYDTMRKRGWKETEDEKNWDFSWVEKDWMAEVRGWRDASRAPPTRAHRPRAHARRAREPRSFVAPPSQTFDTMHFEPHQRVNHYRNSRELCRKDLLIKNLKRQKRQLQREGNAEEAAAYDFWPMTYMLPGDYALFAEEFKRLGGSGSGAWIMKPIGRSQGKGIFIFKTLSAISKWRTDGKFKSKSSSSSSGGASGGDKDGDADKDGKKEPTEPEAYVVQRYIANPYLIGGKKFDLRLYILVTSYMPLTVWMYRGGFCRFSTQRCARAIYTHKGARRRSLTAARQMSARPLHFLCSLSAAGTTRRSARRTSKTASCTSRTSRSRRRATRTRRRRAAASGRSAASSSTSCRATARLRSTRSSATSTCSSCVRSTQCSR